MEWHENITQWGCQMEWASGIRASRSGAVRQTATLVIHMRFVWLPRSGRTPHTSVISQGDKANSRP